jgi:hypothetical protein
MPGGIRTFNLRFRRPMLYPIELQAHKCVFGISGGIRTPNLQFRRLPLYPVELQRHKYLLGDPYGIRTRISNVRGCRPSH